MIAFELTMPRNNSWNGRWSGAESRYIKCFRLGEASERKILAHGDSHYYDFGDGWAAEVSVRSIDGKEARKLRKISKGFCGYDWMIDEIRTYGRIKKLAERIKRDPIPA